MACCVKCHSLDCIGCGACEQYNMDDDGSVEPDEEEQSEYINYEFEPDPFGGNS